MHTQETFSSPRVKLELNNKVKPNSRKQLVIDIKSMNSQKSKDLEKTISELATNSSPHISLD